MSSNNHEIELMNKCDFENQDLNSIETQSVWECGEKCSNFTNCTHFSYLSSDLKCFMKTGIRDRKHAKFNELKSCGLLKSKMVCIF